LDLALTGNLVPGRRDGFTPADRATAGGVQPFPFLENESTSLAGCGFHRQPLGVSGAGDMLQVIKNFFFPDPEDLGNLPQVEGTCLQRPGNFLPQGQHFPICAGD